MPLPADGGLVTLRGSDPNGDPLTFSTSAPSGVTISQVGDVTCFATGDGSSACSATVTVTPASTVSGSSWSGSFGYTASDGSSNSTSAAVTVRNAAPRAMPDNIVVASEGGVARLVGLDTSGDNVTFEVTSENNVDVGPISPLGCGAVSAGATECRASANVTPTPPATLTTAWSGSFTYRVVDGTSVSPTATVDVRNASPVASDFEVAADTAGTVVHLEGTDANGDALRFEVGSASGVTVGTPDPALCGVEDASCEHLHLSGAHHTDRRVVVLQLPGERRTVEQPISLGLRAQPDPERRAAGPARAVGHVVVDAHRHRPERRPADVLHRQPADRRNLG